MNYTQTEIELANKLTQFVQKTICLDVRTNPTSCICVLGRFLVDDEAIIYHFNSDVQAWKNSFIETNVTSFHRELAHKILQITNDKVPEFTSNFIDAYVMGTRTILRDMQGNDYITLNTQDVLIANINKIDLSEGLKNNGTN